MSMADNTRRVLQKAYSGHTGLSWGWLADTAEVVAANPAALFDAMVADGMARAVVWCPVHNRDEAPERNLCRSAGITVTRYEVVPPEPPHVHEWSVCSLHTGEQTVKVRCECTETHHETRIVSATLPIEEPS